MDSYKHDVQNNQSSFFSPSQFSGNFKNVNNNQTPNNVLTQQNVKNFISENNNLRRSNDSADNQSTISSDKILPSMPNYNTEFNLKPKNIDSIEYNKKSLSDLDYKTNQIKTLNDAGSNISRKEQSQTINPVSTSNQITNNVSNVSNVLTDYIKNIKADYSRLPQWKTDIG